MPRGFLRNSLPDSPYLETHFLGKNSRAFSFIIIYTDYSIILTVQVTVGETH